MNEKNNIVPIDEKLNIAKSETENIKNLIYTIRGKQVMLDSDVAMLYQYPTKRINEAVRRNIERFPENFCFKLTEIEAENYGGRRTLPYVFTEQGIAMLSGLLRNQVAIQVSIRIMNAFVEMRKFIARNGQVFERLTNVEYKILEQNKMLTEHEKKFEKVFDEIQKNEKIEFKQSIFFDGQICENACIKVDNHFREVTKMVQIRSGARRNLQDYILTRYACYLIAQNGDSKKEEIAFAQTYFAVQTRKQEIIEDRIKLMNQLEAREKL